jgi:hypothetical protein
MQYLSKKYRLTEQGTSGPVNILFRNGVRDAVVGNLPKSAALATVDIFKRAGTLPPARFALEGDASTGVP